MVRKVKGRGVKVPLFLWENAGFKVGVKGLVSWSGHTIQPRTYFKKGDHITIDLS